MSNKVDITEVIEGLGLSYNLGNAVEQIAQAQALGDRESLVKAKWHIERQIKLQGGGTTAAVSEAADEDKGPVLSFPSARGSRKGA